jgi:hypothetical protein
MDDLHPKTGSPDIDPEKLPAIFPVMTASRLLHIGRDRTYELVHKGEYPVRVLDISGRFRVTRVDLLRFLGYEIRAAS